MQVFMIQQHDPDNWNAPRPITMALAVSEEAAKRWIQDEVDHKHGIGMRYMPGKDAEWWIARGNFSITSVPVFE